MKRSYVLIFSLLTFISCDDVSFAPIVGKWQLKTVVKNGEITTVDTVWYNFQNLSIFSLQIYSPQNDRYADYVGVRTQEDNTLSIKILDGSFRYSDWNDTTRSFTIIKLNRRRMILQSEEGYLYTFNKY